MRKNYNKKLYIATPLVNSIFSFLTFPLLISKLSLEQFGQYSLILTFIAVFIVFFGFSLNQVINANFQAWHLKREEETELYKILFFQILISILLSCFIMSFSFLFFTFDTKIVFFILIITISNSFMQTLLAYFRMQEKVVVFAFLTAFPGVLNSLLKISYLYIEREYTIQMLLFIDLLSTLFIYIFLIKHIKVQYLQIRIGKEFFIDKMKFAFPLIYNALIRRFTYFYDKILISFLFGYKALGLYMIAYHIYNYVHLILSAYKNYWIPFIIKNHEDVKSIQRENDQIILLFFVLGVLSMLLLYPFLSFFNNGEFSYQDIMKLLPFLLVNIFFQILFFGLGTIPLIQKNTKPLYKINTINVLMSLIYGLIFVYFFGTIGAIAMLIINNLVTLYQLNRAYDTKNIKFSFIYIALFISIYIFIGVFFENLHNS